MMRLGRATSKIQTESLSNQATIKFGRGLSGQTKRRYAIGVSVDKPAVDPKRRISVLNADRVEISTVPVYSKPA
jgi:hypothetical protein